MAKKILVADDEPYILMALTDAVEMEGYDCVTAINGKEAVEKAREELPDLILLDIMMPYKDGYEVCEELKADDQTKDIPVIMLTAKSQQVDIQRARRSVPTTTSPSLSGPAPSGRSSTKSSMRVRSSERAERSLPALVLGGLLLTSLAVSCTNAGKDAVPLRVGYMICNSLDETQARFAPLSAYLSEQLGREVRPVYLDTVDFEDAVKAGEFDLIHTNSLLYIWFSDEYDFRILSGEKRGRYGSFATGNIVVHADSDIRSVADLKGKRFVFGPPLAPTAHISPYHLLLQGGVDPEADLFYAIPWGSFKHEKALYGVWHGKYDAAAAPSLDLELMERDSKLPWRICGLSPKGPRCPIASSPRPPRFQRRRSARYSLFFSPLVTRLPPPWTAKC